MLVMGSPYLVDTDAAYVFPDVEIGLPVPSPAASLGRRTSLSFFSQAKGLRMIVLIYLI